LPRGGVIRSNSFALLTVASASGNRPRGLKVKTIGKARG